jgi:hypothetical protein
MAIAQIQEFEIVNVIRFNRLSTRVLHISDGARRLVLDGNGRESPSIRSNIRLLHHLQKLSRIGPQALDIAALALGIDRVEGGGRIGGDAT